MMIAFSFALGIIFTLAILLPFLLICQNKLFEIHKELKDIALDLAKLRSQLKVENPTDWKEKKINDEAKGGPIKPFTQKQLDDEKFGNKKVKEKMEEFLS